MLKSVKEFLFLMIRSNRIPQFSLKGGRFLQYDIQTSADLTNWTAIGVTTISNLDGTAEINDTNSAAPGQRFYRAVSHSN